MTKSKQLGKIIFAGAGPGDPELISIKAMRALCLAEVVITDRLVSQAIINEYVKDTALLIHVGKQYGNKSSTPQAVINDLLIKYALQGKMVVRLKGGDISLFSNILDELLNVGEAGRTLRVFGDLREGFGLELSA